MKRWTIASITALMVVLAACKPPETAPIPKNDPVPKLEIVDLAIGTGDAIVTGKTAVVHYTGWLFDTLAANRQGKKFDSSRDRGEPFRFAVGQGQVIKGWDEGIVGMKVGGQRRLVIPSQFGYGATGSGGSIPPNADLLFDVELLAVE
jgi:FKBP-type peptidyl-prolyl cis-trans isomerase FkpA